MASELKGQKHIDLLIGDNSLMYAQLMAEALQRDGHLRVVDFAATECEFLELAARHALDVVIIRATRSEGPMGGITTLCKFHDAYPHIPAIVLLDSPRREDVLEAFRSGARGIFSKHESLESLCKCVRVVSEGQIWANTREIGFALEALTSTPSIRAVSASGMNLLTKREEEVVQQVAEGLSNREIGVHLGLSPHTVKNHLLRIFDKIGVCNRVELLRLTLCHPSSLSGEGSVRKLRIRQSQDSLIPRRPLTSESDQRVAWKLATRPRRVDLRQA